MQIPKVSPLHPTPPPVANIWTDLCSAKWSDPFISFPKVAPVATATEVRLMQDDCSIMRGERGLFQ